MLRLALATSAMLLSSTAHAATLFNDDFDTEALSLNTKLDNWNVVQGSVDVVGNCAGTGRCVDLDGSMPGSLPTIMEAKLNFSISAGNQYIIDFNISNGTAIDPFTVSLGSFFSQSFSGYTLPLSQSLSFIPTSSGAAFLGFALDTASNNNFGPYLTQVSLSENVIAPSAVPLPASGLMLLASAGLLTVARRRKKPSRPNVTSLPDIVTSSSRLNQMRLP